MFKLLELSHHFDKVNQTKFFINVILASENRQKKSYFHSHLLRSNAPFKVLKMYVLWQCFFEKPKNVETLNILLVKNRDKDFSNVKTLITKDHSSLNCGP